MKSRLSACFDLFREAWVEYQRDGAKYFAAAMVYYVLVSLVPLLLLLLSALGLLLRVSRAAAELEQRTLHYFQGRFGAEFAGMLNRLLAGVEQASVLATVVSVVGILLSASVLFRHLRLTFRAIWKFEPLLTEGSVRIRVLVVLRERLVALVIVLGGGCLLLATLVIIVVSQWLNRLAAGLPLLRSVEVLFGVGSSLLLAFVTFAVLLKVLPPLTLRWRDVWLAASVCAIGWVLVSEILPLYGSFFESNPNAYSAIAALLPVLLIVNLVSQMLFFCAELSRVVATRQGEPAIRSAPSRGWGT